MAINTHVDAIGRLDKIALEECNKPSNDPVAQSNVIFLMKYTYKRKQTRTRIYEQLGRGSMLQSALV